MLLRRMTADEFVSILRGGSEKVRVDELVLTTHSGEFHGKGMMRIGRDAIKVDMTINKGEQPPEMRAGVFTQQDSWKIRGVIEDDLGFWCNSVAPFGNKNTRYPSGTTRCTFGLNPLELVPSGLDAMPRKAREEYLRLAVNQNAPLPSEPYRTDDGQDVCFSAILLEFPLLAPNWHEEVKGETPLFRYRLVKDKENSDLRVLLESKSGYQSTGEDEDWARFHAFLTALAFVTGVNAWPYRVEYWRDGQKISDRLMAADKLGRTSHAPFSKGLAFNARTEAVEWNFREALGRPAAFFEANTLLSREVSEILYLFRMADHRVHADITTIALCVLFENFVRLLFSELKLSGSVPGQNLESFEQARQDVLAKIEPKIAAQDAGYTRLANIVRSAQLFTMEQMVGALVSYFSLDAKYMGQIFQTWKQARHPLVHHKRRAEQSEAELKESMLCESRIGGAINILALRLFGYSGIARVSSFEDDYRKI